VALAGTAIGAVLSLWITHLVVSRAPSRLPRLDDVSLDANVFIFAVAMCALTISFDRHSSLIERTSAPRKHSGSGFA
jgi:hypothetical protein